MKEDISFSFDFRAKYVVENVNGTSEKQKIAVQSVLTWCSAFGLSVFCLTEFWRVGPAGPPKIPYLSYENDDMIHFYYHS